MPLKKGRVQAHATLPGVCHIPLRICLFTIFPTISTTICGSFWENREKTGLSKRGMSGTRLDDAHLVGFLAKNRPIRLDVCVRRVPHLPMCCQVEIFVDMFEMEIFQQKGYQLPTTGRACLFEVLCEGVNTHVETTFPRNSHAGLGRSFYERYILTSMKQVRKVPTQSGVAISRKCCFPHGSRPTRFDWSMCDIRVCISWPEKITRCISQHFDRLGSVQSPKYPIPDCSF